MKNDRSLTQTALKYFERKQKESSKKRKTAEKNQIKESKVDLKQLELKPPKGVKKLLFPLLRPKKFWEGGMSAVYEDLEPVIQDPDYRDLYGKTLSQYLWGYYHQKKFLHSIKWMGIQTYKTVTDLWVYQEIIHETQPDFIIEIGSLYGGSTLFLAHMLDIIGKGEVISIDISREVYEAAHPRIQTLTGNSSSSEIVSQVQNIVQGKKVMLIHDGDHTEAAVLKDLNLYSKFISMGDFIIVEDGILELFNPKRLKVIDSQQGALKAIDRFLGENPGAFEIAKEYEKFIITSNPRGYLRRIA